MSYPFTMKGAEVTDEVEYVEWSKVDKKGRLRRGHFWREKHGKPPTGMRFVKANGCWYIDATVRISYKSPKRRSRNRATETRLKVWSTGKLSDEKLVNLAVTALEESANFDWFDFHNTRIVMSDDQRFRTDNEALHQLRELTESDEDLEIEDAKTTDLKGWGVE